VVVSAGAEELGVAVVVRVYRTEEPAAVGLVVVEVIPDVENVGLAAEDSG
jgi:hypothetical protein